MFNAWSHIKMLSNHGSKYVLDDTARQKMSPMLHPVRTTSIGLQSHDMPLSMIIVIYSVIIYSMIIIESVDSISRDGPDTPIHVLHIKKPNDFIQIRSLVYCVSWP